MNLDVIARIADRKIQEAIEEGKFDNLPGQGKPLVFDEDTSVPAHLRMANHVLKNANVLPEWIQVREEIVSGREAIVALRARLVHEGLARRSRLEALPANHPEVRSFAEWHARSRASYHRHLKSVNIAILKFSMLAPAISNPFFSYRIDAEMSELDAEFPPLAQQPDVPPEETGGESSLKKLARVRYQEGEGGGPVRGWARTARLFGLKPANKEPDTDV